MDKEYSSLARMIADYLGEPLAALPEAVRERVTSEFPISWDALSSTQRLVLAQQQDVQRDPAMAATNEYWFNLACQIGEAEQELERWQMRSDGGVPSEARIKEEEIAKLKRRLSELRSLWEAEPFSAMVAQGTTTSTLPESSGTTPPSIRVYRHKLRANSLDVPVERAIKLAGSLKTGAVWLELRKLAMDEEKPFTGEVDGDSLCYTTDDNTIAKLTKDSLRKRLNKYVGTDLEAQLAEGNGR